MEARRAEGVFENAIGFRESRRDVTDEELVLPLDVLVRPHRPLRKHEPVLLGVFVYDRRRIGESDFRVEQRLEFFVLNGNRGNGRFSDLRRFGRHRDDKFADEAHASIASTGQSHKRRPK